MAITALETAKIAKLARLHLSAEALAHAETELNQIFDLIADLQAVDTTNIEPLAHPLSMIENVALRLRDDVVSETNNREANMQNAPEAEKGYFLVPKVIE